MPYIFFYAHCFGLDMDITTTPMIFNPGGMRKAITLLELKLNHVCHIAIL